MLLYGNGGPILFSFFFFCLFIFRERGREGEKEGETSMCECVVASQVPPTRDLAHNSSMCSDWESNQ